MNSQNIYSSIKQSKTKNTIWYSTIESLVQFTLSSKQINSFNKKHATSHSLQISGYNAMNTGILSPRVQDTEQRGSLD